MLEMTSDTKVLLWTICGVSWIISIACVKFLLRTNDTFIGTLFWLVVLLIPILGPLFYLGFYNPPSIRPVDQQADHEWTDHGSGNDF